MNVLLLNQFYPPDVAPTGQVLRDLAETLASRGHQVTVVCSTRSYEGHARYPVRDHCSGVCVRRVRALGFGRLTHAGRLLDYASFMLGAFITLLRAKPKPDLIVALTTPPYIGLVAKAAARLRNLQHGHWIMDLYPDVLAAHGMVTDGSLAYGILGRLTRWELGSGRLNLALGPCMARRAARYVPGAASIRWVPLWGGVGYAEPLLPGDGQCQRSRRGWKPGTLVLMYSGNMGLGHRFAEILAAAERTADDPRIKWVFAGGGKRRAEIEDFARRMPRANIELLPYAPSHLLWKHLRSADVHLVSLDPSWQGCMIPSKLQTIFWVGRAVIFVGGGDNSLAQWIVEAGAGWVVPPGDVDGLLRAVEEARDPATREIKGACARAFAEARFDPRANSGQICDWIERTAVEPAR